MTRFQPAAFVLAALTTLGILGGVGALADTEYRQVVAQSAPGAGAVAMADAPSGPVLVVAGQRVSL
ncbi:hypothetical protein [Ideonella sp.]|uniref:hypothetical protein n=1 Tax=Ideonella sp. TaxID=1929293 RepID=UPI0035B35FBF